MRFPWARKIGSETGTAFDRGYECGHRWPSRGCGAFPLATLPGEFGDLRDFDRAAKLLEHAGLDRVESGSSQRKGLRRISRRGRRLLFALDGQRA